MMLAAAASLCWDTCMNITMSAFDPNQVEERNMIGHKQLSLDRIPYLFNLLPWVQMNFLAHKGD